MFRDTKYIHDKKIITTNFRIVVSSGGEGEYDHGRACGRLLEWEPQQGQFQGVEGIEARNGRLKDELRLPT